MPRATCCSLEGRDVHSTTHSKATEELRPHALATEQSVPARGLGAQARPT